MVCFLRQAGQSCQESSCRVEGGVCEVFGRRCLMTSCAKGRETKRIHTAWTVEMTDVKMPEEKVVQRSIFSTRIFWQLHLQQNPPFSAQRRSLQQAEIKSVLPNSKADSAFITTLLQDTYVHPHSQPCHRSDPAAYSQASVCPAQGASPCRLLYWPQRLTAPVKDVQGSYQWDTSRIDSTCWASVMWDQGELVTRSHAESDTIRKNRSAMLSGNPLIWLQGRLWRELSIGHWDHKYYSIMYMFPKALGCS